LLPWRRRSEEHKPAARVEPARVISSVANKPYVGEPELIIDTRIVDSYSRILTEPDFYYVLVLNTAPVARVPFKVAGDPKEAIRDLARRIHAATGNIEKPYYVAASRGGDWLRMIIGGSKLVAVLYEKEGVPLTGSEALEELARRTFEATVTVSEIKPPTGEWKPEYTVYVKSMDEQHKTFFVILRRLFESLVTGNLEEEGGIIFSSLADYTRSHFKSEEWIMERYNYPEEELAKHRAEHARFTRIVYELRDQFNRDPSSIRTSVFHYTRDWLVNHILGVDKKYGEYFRKMGIRVDH